MLLGIYVRVQTLWGDVRERITDDKGAIATEYALLLLLIAIAIVTAATALGTAIKGRFEAAEDCLTGGPCP